MVADHQGGQYQGRVKEGSDTRDWNLQLLSAAMLVSRLPARRRPRRAQDFFAGKTVTLVVGYQAGSLYDTNARFVARHLARFIPGNPTVIVRNMPGAGTLTAANNVANLAPKDGTTIGLIARGMSIEPLLGGQGVRFEPLALNWIGSTSQEVSVIAVRTDTGVKTLDDVKTREVAVAGPAPGTDGVTFPTTLNNLLGTKFKIVTGYRSGAEMTLAVERREVDGRGSWSWASFRNDGMAMLKRGELTLLVQMAIAKSPDIPQVPLVMDYAKTEEQRQVLELLLAGQAMAWPVFAPAGGPAGACRAAAQVLSRRCSRIRRRSPMRRSSASTSIRCRARRSSRCSSASTRRRRR